MVDWNGLAAEKYAIMNKQAESDRITAEANAGLANTKAAVMPFEVNSQIGLNKAHADQLATLTSLAPTTAFGEMRYRDAMGQQALANARHDDMMTGLLPGQVTGQQQYQDAQTGLLRTQTAAQQADTSWLDSPGHPFLLDMARSRFSGPTGSSMSSAGVKKTGYKTGTEKVPGKGDGTVDTVPAKLAPGEAVLNKAAAEHLGRDVISALNEAGAMVMGLDPHNGAKLGEDAYATNKGGSKEKGENQKTLGYAKGTAKVPGKGAAAKGKKGGGMPPASGPKKGGKAPAAQPPNGMHAAAAGGLLQALAQYGRQKAMGSAA